jgi:hypothetical protein
MSPNFPSLRRLSRSLGVEIPREVQPQGQTELDSAKRGEPGQGWSIYPQNEASFFALSPFFTKSNQGGNLTQRYRQRSFACAPRHASQDCPQTPIPTETAQGYQNNSKLNVGHSSAPFTRKTHSNVMPLGSSPSQEGPTNEKHPDYTQIVASSQSNESKRRTSPGIPATVANAQIPEKSPTPFKRGQHDLGFLEGSSGTYPEKDAVCSPTATMPLRLANVLAFPRALWGIA